jgi:hypothetical protein
MTDGVGLGVSVGDLGPERWRPRLYRLRRLRAWLWSLVDSDVSRDIDLFGYESDRNILAAIDDTLAQAGLPPHREPATAVPVGYDLPSNGLSRLQRRLGEPLVDVYLPRELDGVLERDGFRIASAHSLLEACERAASELGSLPEPDADPADLERDDEERYACAVLIAAARTGLRQGAAVVIG